MDKISGYKTYIASVGGIVYGVAGLFGHKLPEDTGNAVVIIIACCIALFMRIGIKKGN